MEELVGQNNLWSAFYWKDYLADTGGLNLEEHGVYLLLMANYYATERPLPAEIKVLQRIAKAFDVSEIAALRSVLRQFFTRDGDVFRHKRIDLELTKRHEISEKRTKAAYKSHANAPALAEQEHTHTHTHTQESKSGAKRATQLPSDFEPNDNNKTVAKELGVNLASQLLAFKDHHLAKGSRFLDWHRALNTWLRRSPDFAHTRKPVAPVTTGSALDNLRALEEKYK
jgi:uncharacterized protein YdaU (DUF1376 family)